MIFTPEQIDTVEIWVDEVLLCALEYSDVTDESVSIVAEALLKTALAEDVIAEAMKHITITDSKYRGLR